MNPAQLHILKPQRRHRVYTIEDLCQLKDDGNRWLVHNMIPRIGRTIAYGHGGSFKTSCMFDLGVAVASGGSLMRQFPVTTHGPVFIVSAEGSKYTNRDRILAHLRARGGHSTELVARGGKPPIPTVSEVPLHYCQQSYIFDDPNDRKEFEEDMRRIRPVLVILDPLDSFIEGDENSAKETKTFRRYLDEIVGEFECSLVVIHHSTKETKDRQASIRGSSAWRGWIDSSLYFDRKTFKDGNVEVPYLSLVSQKQRDGQEGHIFSVLPEFDNERNMVTYQIVPDDGADIDSLMRSKTEQDIIRLLIARGPLTQKDIIEVSKLSHKRVSLALNQLAIDGYIDNDVEVPRATSSDGSRTRMVKAWRSIAKISAVDAIAAILKNQGEDDNVAAELELRRELPWYDGDPDGDGGEPS